MIYNYTSSKQAYEDAKSILIGITDNADFEAMELTKHFLHISKSDILLDKPLVSDIDCASLFDGARRRAEGYPLQYILGDWEFYGLPIMVGEGVLIPRPDTETLVDVALDYSKKHNKQLKVLDLCSGSGCVAIALKKNIISAEVYALEKSSDAISFLKQNCKLNNVDITIIQDDAICPKTMESDFDIIVANPPYLTKNDMQNLQKEVTFEPKMALFGSDDGLEFYRELTKIWKSRLKVGGILAFEIGQNQHTQVGFILSENGFKDVCNRCDLCAIIRVVFAIK